METNEIEKKPPADWNPESDQLVQAAVGKLGEEAAELAKICFRISIQGLSGSNPADQKPNIDELTDEVADILAMSELASRYLGMDPVAIEIRKRKKIAFKQPWFERLRQKQLEINARLKVIAEDDPCDPLVGMRGTKK